MDANERKGTVSKVLGLSENSRANITGESLAMAERVVNALPDDMPLPHRVHASYVRGIVLAWRMYPFAECWISVNHECMVRGDLRQVPYDDILSQFNQHGSESVEVPEPFMDEFRKQRGKHLAHHRRYSKVLELDSFRNNGKFGR